MCFQITDALILIPQSKNFDVDVVNLLVSEPMIITLHKFVVLAYPAIFATSQCVTAAMLIAEKVLLVIHNFHC